MSAPTLEQTATIEVYSTGPSCMKCRLTHRGMVKAGIDHAYLDMTEDGFTAPADVQAIIDRLQVEKGSAPIVVVRDAAGAITESWNDFHPDLIKGLTA